MNGVTSYVSTFTVRITLGSKRDLYKSSNLKGSVNEYTDLAVSAILEDMEVSTSDPRPKQSKRPVVHRAEISMKPEQVRLMLKLAKMHSLRDYVLLALMSMCGLRVGEIVGNDRRVSRTGKKGFCKGLMIEHIREDGIWVYGKGVALGRAKPVIQPVPKQLREDIRQLCQGRTEGKLMDISIIRVWQICRRYAKMAGFEDWEKAHPHRLRHYYITQAAKLVGRDPFKVQSLARHKLLSTTARYVAEMDPDEKAEIVEKLS